MRLLLILVCTIFLTTGLPLPAGACSQCMCGTPFPSDLFGGVVPAQFTYGLEERYLSKSNALDEAPGVEEEREHRIAGFGLWRPTNRIAVLGKLPFNVKEITTQPLGEVTSKETSRGLGDAELLVLGGLFHSGGRWPIALGVVVGGAA